MAAFVVTGGFGVLGRAVGHAALARGWTVALIDVAPTVPDELATIPNLACFAGVDLMDEAAAGSVFADIETRFGGVTGLANVAGGFAWTLVGSADPKIWKHLYDMNVMTTILASRAALPMLKRSQGNIVNVGAFAALHAASGMAPYTVAKSGVHRVTESLADELRPSGVRVNAVLPSIIDTPANRRDMAGADTTAWVTPNELAQVILFLASQDARAINGVLLPVTK